VLTGPGDQTIEANGPGGASLTFTVTGADVQGAFVAAVQCSPTSGAQFSLGKTTVRCTAPDEAGNVGTLSFEVNVVDTTAPAINAPDVSFTATSAAGIPRTAPAIAAYLAGISASDLVSAATVTTTMPESLPIGATDIAVSATDAAGNTAKKTVTVTVLPPGTPAPPPDFTPPLPVAKAVAKPGDRSITLSWIPPARDVASVAVRRALVGAPGAGVVIYRGMKRTVTDRGLRNAVGYRYVLVAFDKVGNASRSVVLTATPVAQLLAQPKPASRIAKPPMLRWAGVNGATYYNVQVWTRGVKVLSAWPKATSLQLAGQWTFNAKSLKLKPGLYTWFVWPGIGPVAQARYGKLLGKSTFVVTTQTR
jgi:hypothetical protein